MNRMPTAPGIRPGHFVDGRRFALTERHQAIARAEYLANMYGRAMYVVSRYDIGGEPAITFTAGDAASVSSALLACIGA